MRSDFSEEEARFFVAGKPVVGTGNVLTGLIKYIGKYTELQQYGRTDEISLYNPDSDVFFMYENMGYTTLRKILAKTTIPISRRYIKALSRKWPMSFVRISFDATHIISVLLEYIFSNYDLKTVCLAYLSDHDIRTGWNRIIPIQYEFLGERIQNRHTDWKEAERIVRELTLIAPGGNK